MPKLDTQSRIDFDRTIGTEDRFNLRKWFENLVEVLNQSNPQLWGEVLADDVIIEGFTDIPMGTREFFNYARTQFGRGEYLVRYPNLRATFQNGLFVLSGTFESFTDGILLCAGDIVVEIVKGDDDFFKLKRQQLNPRFRVQ